MSNRTTLWIWVGAILGIIALVCLGLIIHACLGDTAFDFWLRALPLILIACNICIVLSLPLVLLVNGGYKAVQSNGQSITFLMIILVMLIVTYFVLPTWLIQYVAAWMFGSKILPVYWETFRARWTPISHEQPFQETPPLVME